MITVREVVNPSSAAEAFEALQKNRFATLLGGGAFLRMGSKNITTLIDLSRCGLDRITEQKDDWEIGAMVTLGELERHGVLNDSTRGILNAAVREIVGVQLRNVVTVGGSVYSRYGFSDLLTGLLALPVRVKLYKTGLMALESFLEKGSEGRDLLEKVQLMKGTEASSFHSIRKTTGDFALLNAAAAITNGQLRISVGARPGRARLATEAMALLEKGVWTDDLISKASDLAAKELTFGTNSRGSGEYRQELCRILVRRVLKEVGQSDAAYDR